LEVLVREQLDISSRSWVVYGLCSSAALAPGGKTPNASITAVARLLGVTEASVYQALKKGCRSGGFHWRRA
jgi:hypothetical protein